MLNLQDQWRKQQLPTGVNIVVRPPDEQELAWRVVLLQKVELMGSLDRDLLPSIAEALVAAEVEPHAAIITVGEPGDGMYFLERGEAEVIIEGECVMTYSQGGFFGEKVRTLAHMRDIHD